MRYQEFIRLSTLVPFLVCAVLTGSAVGDVHTWFFELNGDQENPPVVTNARGHCIVTLDDQSREVQADCTWINLSSLCTGAHIHIGAPGVNGGVILPLTHTSTGCGISSGSTTFSVANANAMLAGNTYINVHSQNHAGGEIRGQVVNEPPLGDPMVEYKFDLTGDQEVPPVASNGLGNCYVTLNVDTRFVEVDCTFAGLSSNATAAHIHVGAAGVSGPPILTLAQTTARCGTITGSGILSQANMDAMLADETYINLHSVSFGGGELRGQLINPEPKPTPCTGDLDGNDTVNVFDLLDLLAAWGPCADPDNCPADLDGSGAVNVFDLLELLANWGPCP